MTITIQVWFDDRRWCAYGGEIGGGTHDCRNAEVAVQIIQRQALEHLMSAGPIPRSIVFDVVEGRPE